MDKKQSTSAKISSYKNVSMGIIILTIILLVVLSVTTGVLERSWHFIQVQTGYIKEDNRLVTFYQWLSPNGEMIISKTKPTQGNFTTFLASSDLQETNYDIDPILIKKGQSARDELLTRKQGLDSEVLTVQQVKAQNNKLNREYDKRFKCERVGNEIKRLEDKFEKYSMEDNEFSFYQEKLRNAKWEKQQLKCNTP